MPQQIFGILILAVWTMTLFQIRGWKDTSPVFFLLPAVGIFMLFGHYIVAGIGTLSARKAFFDKTVKITFTNEGYKIEEPGATATVDWSGILDVVVAPDGFLIRPNVHQGIWIPLAAFADANGGPLFAGLLKSAGVATRRP